ncbi:MAG: preprotein translocase subunit YajC [Candidatus Microbacterium stercoravium]
MDILLLVVAGALLIFMFWSSSRRRKKMQAEEQKRQQSLTPGTPVMTRSGLYGTLVSFDPEDLTTRAVIAIAPGVEVEVHAQTVTLDQESLQDDEPEEYDDEIESGEEFVDEAESETLEEQIFDDVRVDDEQTSDDTDERKND